MIFLSFHLGVKVENGSNITFEKDELPLTGFEIKEHQPKFKTYFLQEEINLNVLGIKSDIIEIQNLLYNDEIDASITKFEILKTKIEFYFGDHPLLLSLYESFGLFYFKLGFIDDAQLLFKSGIFCGERSLPKTHIKLIPFYLKLSEIYNLKSMFQEEMDILSKALLCIKDEDDIQKAGILKRMAEILILTRKIIEAKGFFIKSLEIYLKSAEINHLKIFELYLNLSHLSKILCEGEESTNYLLFAFEIYDRFIKSGLDGLIRFFQISFDIIVRTMEEESRKKLLILSQIVDKSQILSLKNVRKEEFILEEAKKFKNSFIFLKCLLDEVTYIMKKLGNDEEFWIQYVEQIEMQDDFKLKK